MLQKDESESILLTTVIMYTYISVSSSMIPGISFLALSINTKCVVVVASSILRIVIVFAVCLQQIECTVHCITKYFFFCNLHCYVIFILRFDKSECPNVSGVMTCAKLVI